MTVVGIKAEAPDCTPDYYALIVRKKNSFLKNVDDAGIPWLCGG